jgi:hypothetical protein
MRCSTSRTSAYPDIPSVGDDDDNVGDEDDDPITVSAVPVARGNRT